MSILPPSEGTRDGTQDQHRFDHAEGKHDPDLVPGCPVCDEETEAMEDERNG